MQMLYDPLRAWICTAAGLGIFTAVMIHALWKNRSAGWEKGAASLLPAAAGLVLAKAGYVLLQTGEMASVFHWCFTMGLVGMLAGTFCAARITREKTGLLLDRTAPALGVAMAAARLSQRWLGEVGAGPWLEENSILGVPFLMLRNQWDETLTALFIPEALMGLAAAGVAWMLLKGRKSHSAEKTAGEASGAMVLLLTIPQILLEQFRTGHYMHWRMVRAEQVLCALAALAVILFFNARSRETSRENACTAFLPSVIYLLLCAAIILIQFVLDGKLMELPETVCWGGYLLSIAGMLICGMVSVTRESRSIR